MLSRLANISLRRVCVIGAIAAAGFVLLVFGFSYALNALFLLLARDLPLPIAAAAIAASCILAAIICFFSLRSSAKRTGDPAALGLNGLKSTNSQELGAELGVALAAQLQNQLALRPKQSLFMACIAGVAAGAAPEQTAQALKALNKALKY